MFSKKYIIYNTPNHQFFRPTLNGCSPVNLLHIFWTLFSKKTYGGLLLSIDHCPFVFAITGHTNNLILHCNKKYDLHKYVFLRVLNSRRMHQSLIPRTWQLLLYIPNHSSMAFETFWLLQTWGEKSIARCHLKGHFIFSVG